MERQKDRYTFTDLYLYIYIFALLTEVDNNIFKVGYEVIEDLIGDLLNGVGVLLLQQPGKHLLLVRQVT